MDLARIRWAAAVLSAGLWLISVGCGGGDPCQGVYCPSGQVCLEGECLIAGDQTCEPECPVGEVCQFGRCVSESGGCDYQGQACASAEHLQWSDQFLCVDWMGGPGTQAVCSRDCATEACPAGSACFAVIPGQMRSCTASTDCNDQEICYNGQCVAAVCRPSECDITRGSDSGCTDGQICGQLENGFSMCMPAGNRQPGEQCIDAARAMDEGRYAEGCIADAICLGGICQAFCADQQCPDDHECVAADLGGGEQVSICARTCQVSAGEDSGCDAQETCVPTSSGQGLCRPAGDIPAFQRCDGGDGLCEAGTICAEEENGDPLWRCLPVCDLSAGGNGEVDSAAQSARDATCPQPESQEGVWMIWHLAEAGEAVDLYVDGDFLVTVEAGSLGVLSDGDFFEVRSEGAVSWRVHEQGAPSTDLPLAEGSFELSAAQARLLTLVPEPGRDRALDAEVITLEEIGQLQWIQGIPDLDTVDVWALADGADPALWLEALSPGQGDRFSPAPGNYELRLIATGEGADGEALVVYDDVQIVGDERMVAFRGTMDSGDVHSLGPPLVSTSEIADLEGGMDLALSCRAVNGGSVGACMERCDGLEMGRCRGDDMGCAPRYHGQRNQWSTVCQPVGQGVEGDYCDPFSDGICGEGLYCEAYGDAAEHAEQTSLGGRCAPQCLVGSESHCASDSWCRPLTGTIDYEVGECRRRCDFEGDYEDAQCPQGLQSCKPEGRLVPAGDGVTGGLEVEENPPLCWASGTRQVGEACNQGDCTPGAECLFDRSSQTGLVETLLSPYFGGAGAAPQCRPICDPFTGQPAAHQCGDDQTCLFNYPWNANVGHCADLVEDLGPGQPCDSPGLACGPDSICVDDGAVTQCWRFCQFTGGVADGYHRSTCPTGYQCAPLVADIGICQ